MKTKPLSPMRGPAPKPVPVRPPTPTPKTPPPQITRTPTPTPQTPPPPVPKPVPVQPPTPTPNPKSATAFNQQQQFDEMMPNLANQPPAYKRGGGVKSGSAVSKRADGCAQRGKTRGKIC